MSISVWLYTSPLVKMSAFMFSVGLMRSSISALPSFAGTKRLPMEKYWVWKTRHRLLQLPCLYFLILLLTSSQRLRGAPSFLRIMPTRSQVE